MPRLMRLLLIGCLFFGQSAWAILYSPDTNAASFQIQLKGSGSSCSGVAFSPTCIATAAHCAGAAATAWRQPYTYTDSAGNPIPAPGATVGYRNQSAVIETPVRGDSIYIFQVDRPLNGVSGIPLATRSIEGTAKFYGNGKSEYSRSHVSNVDLEYRGYSDQTEFEMTAPANAAGSPMNVAPGDSGGGLVKDGKLQGILTGNTLWTSTYGNVYESSEEIQAAMRSVCNGRAATVSCQLSVPSIAVDGVPFSYTLTRTGNVVRAVVGGETISPFPASGVYQGTSTISRVGNSWLYANVYGQDGSVSTCVSQPIWVDHKPFCALSASPSTIASGGSTIIQLVASGQVTSATLQNQTIALTQNPNTGDRTYEATYRPTQTTTYTAKVFGPNNTSYTCSKTVTVEPPLVCQSSFSPSRISVNQTSSLTVRVTQGTGVSGQIATTPATNFTLTNNFYTGQVAATAPGTFTYPITVKSASGATASCPAVLTVDAAPTPSPTPTPTPSPTPTPYPTTSPSPNVTCQISTNPTSIYRGQIATLTVRVTPSTTVGRATVFANGAPLFSDRTLSNGAYATQVAPGATTTYTGSVVTSSGKTVTCTSASLRVN